MFLCNGLKVSGTILNLKFLGRLFTQNIVSLILLGSMGWLKITTMPAFGGTSEPLGGLKDIIEGGDPGGGT